MIKGKKKDSHLVGGISKAFSWASMTDDINFTRISFYNVKILLFWFNVIYKNIWLAVTFRKYFVNK